MAMLTIMGIVNTVITLEIAVSETESAVSPRARYVIRFEVGPPGQAARIITPMAISGGTEKIETREYPIKGKRINWLTNPKTIALGYFTTLLKSSNVKDRPMPHMIIIRAKPKIILETLSIADYIV